MSREIYLVRHGLSEANIAGDPAFGSPEAELTTSGKLHATLLGPIFEHILGKSLSEQSVATSKLSRAKQTAQFAGFIPSGFVEYENLNEYDGDVKRQVMTFVAQARRLRKDQDWAGADLAERQAYEVLKPLADALLNDPPKEDVWFTHGLVIAGLTYGKNYREYRVGDYLRKEPARFIPYFSSIRIV